MASPSLITIQKFIYLLDDLHYNEFVKHLEEINATLPLKLTQTIRAKLPEFDTHEKLCEKIYGSFEKSSKQNFNQLASYTFRLTDVLGQNYPDYLHHNISRIQLLLNEGQTENGNFLAEVLLDIAERIDDFECSIFVLNFLCQQAFIVKDIATGIKLDAELTGLLEKERTATNIQIFTRKTLAETKMDSRDLEKVRNYLSGFFGHLSPSVRLLSYQSYMLILYQFELQAFEKHEISDFITRMEKDLHNHSHVVFPYMVDVRGSLYFMKLNSTFGDLNSKESEREFENLSEHYRTIKYWKNFVNMGQIYLITIQCTRLFNNYERYLYRPGYAENLLEQDSRLVQELRMKCERFLCKKNGYIKYDYEIMCYRILYGILLILGGGKNINAGLAELESVLITYQQINLNTETDSIFLCLMAGYFSLKEYNRCSTTFKRYLKNVKSIAVFNKNEIKIYMYYYLSKWLTTEKKQYIAKLNALPGRQENSALPEMFTELREYFNVPVL